MIYPKIKLTLLAFILTTILIYPRDFLIYFQFNKIILEFMESFNKLAIYIHNDLFVFMEIIYKTTKKMNQ